MGGDKTRSDLCPHTGVAIPESSCPICIRHLITAPEQVLKSSKAWAEAVAYRRGHPPVTPSNR